jgi:CheY-like chemotaxis protein
MDRNMPKLNGLLATSELRSRGYNKLVVGLTGSAFDDEVNEFLQHGADVVFSKPFTAQCMNALIDHIEKHGYLSDTQVKYIVMNDELIPKRSLTATSTTTTSITTTNNNISSASGYKGLPPCEVSLDDTCLSHSSSSSSCDFSPLKTRINDDSSFSGSPSSDMKRITPTTATTTVGKFPSFLKNHFSRGGYNRNNSMLTSSSNTTTSTTRFRSRGVISHNNVVTTIGGNNVSTMSHDEMSLISNLSDIEADMSTGVLDYSSPNIMINNRFQTPEKLSQLSVVMDDDEDPMSAAVQSALQSSHGNDNPKYSHFKNSLEIISSVSNVFASKTMNFDDQAECSLSRQSLNMNGINGQRRSEKSILVCRHDYYNNNDEITSAVRRNHRSDSWYDLNDSNDNV